MPAILTLPREEPPEHVKDAFRIVTAWLRDVETKEAATREEYRKMRQAFQNLPPHQDWRDTI